MLNSARILRKIYERLHAEDHINNKASILIRAGEKLIAENKILRIENEDLRDIIFEKKYKKKRGKPLNFYKESEQKDQTLFFNPAKITRARERVTALEKAELQ
jgi:regulator of replication initiation timing